MTAAWSVLNDKSLSRPQTLAHTGPVPDPLSPDPIGINEILHIPHSKQSWRHPSLWAVQWTLLSPWIKVCIDRVVGLGREIPSRPVGLQSYNFVDHSCWVTGCGYVVLVQIVHVRLLPTVRFRPSALFDRWSVNAIDHLVHIVSQAIYRIHIIYGTYCFPHHQFISVTVCGIGKRLKCYLCQH